MHNVFFRFLLFFEKVKFSTKKTKTVHVYFAKNLLQYFRFFVKGFAKMSMTKQNLGFPLDVQNRTEICKITNLIRINTKIIKTRVLIDMPFWILFLIIKLCKITKFPFVFL